MEGEIIRLIFSTGYWVCLAISVVFYTTDHVSDSWVLLGAGFLNLIFYWFLSKQSKSSQ